MHEAGPNLKRDAVGLLSQLVVHLHEAISRGSHLGIARKADDVLTELLDRKRSALKVLRAYGAGQAFNQDAPRSGKVLRRSAVESNCAQLECGLAESRFPSVNDAPDLHPIHDEG
jgi:hypothetical protein